MTASSDSAVARALPALPLPRERVITKPSREAAEPEAADPSAHDRGAPSVRCAGVANGVQPYDPGSGDEPAGSRVLCAVSAHFFVVCRADFCPCPQSTEAFRGAAPGRAGFEVSHAHGGWGFAALIAARHGDVL